MLLQKKSNNKCENKRELKPRITFKICDNILEKPKNQYVYRFVYESTLGVIPEGFEINHINAIKTDNTLRNLEILTHKQNSQLANNKSIISINVETGKKKIYVSIKSAALDLEKMLQVFQKFVKILVKHQNPKSMVSDIRLHSKRIELLLLFINIFVNKFDSIR